jgi:hypothetical protein
VQGLILDEMRMYVVGAFGEPASTEVLKMTGRPRGDPAWVITIRGQ